MRYMLMVLGLCSALWAKPLRVEVTAPSAVLMNADTGAVLYAKNLHERRHAASITKIATALYVLEKKGDALDEIAVVSAEALKSVHASIKQAPNGTHPPHRLEHDGTMMGLKVGEEHTLKTFLYGLMLPSGNDAANVLAEHVGGSVEKFMQELQLFIEGLGLKETSFVNPHGLHHPKHWTTAYDMAILTRHALKSKVLQEIVKSPSYDCPKSSKQPARTLVQNNRLLRPGIYYYPKAIGVKTGYIFKAGRTFVAAAKHEGRTLIATLLGCEKSEHRFRDAVRLFEAAFAEKLVTRTLFAKEKERFSHHIWGAKKEVVAQLKEDLAVQYFPAEEPSFRAEIEWLPCKLPIRKEAKVARLRLVDMDGRVLKEVPLFAAEAVGQTWWRSPLEFLKVYQSIFIGLFLSAQVGLLLFYFLKKNQKVVQS
jgi:serine-type D-Ala-D-Ala carboxypeptidase (penicillin-binding protein 5/6)